MSGTRLDLSEPVSKYVPPEVADWLLQYSNVVTLGDLYQVYLTSPKTLKKNTAVWKVVQPLIKQIEKLNADDLFKSIDEIVQEVQSVPRVSTGIHFLNYYLDPEKRLGLKVGTSLELYGEASSGKSEIASTMVAFAFLPKPYGLAEKNSMPKVFVIDTEGVWTKTDAMIKKIVNILRGRICHPNVSEAIRAIKMTNAYDVDSLLLVLEKLIPKLEEQNSLVVIDSVASPFRLSLPGPENMQLKLLKTSQLLNLLKKIQAKEVPVVLTNQVYSNIGYITTKNPYGGEKLKHYATYRVQVKKASASNLPNNVTPRKVKLVDVVGAPEIELDFAITDYGVVDFNRALGKDKNCAEFPQCECEYYRSLF